MFDNEFESEPLTVLSVNSGSDQDTAGLPEVLRNNFSILHRDRDDYDPDPESFEQQIFGLVHDTDGSAKFPGTDMRGSGVGVKIPNFELDSLQKSDEQRRFVNQVYGYCRLYRFLSEDPEFSDLIDFHSRQKLTLLAHEPVKKEELGHMLANRPDEPIETTLKNYATVYLSALRRLPTRERHFNVLEHLYGYLTELLPDRERNELLETIREFRDGKEPLLVPLEKIKRAFEDRDMEWVNSQSYLNPTSRELELKQSITERIL
jgi:uncharacterized protein YbgA (DUF1722 family)